MAQKIKRLGWKPDIPDHRDHIYSAPVALAAALPPRVDLRPSCPPVYDQCNLGSCTANAIAAAFEFDLMKQGAPDFMPSRLFVYWNERDMEGTVMQDAGAMIRDGVKSVKKRGVCPETIWPYSDEDPGPFQEKPPPACYTEALKHQVTSYQRIPRSLRAMKTCLSAGYPFVLGFTVYESFMSKPVAQTGVVPMPQANEEMEGGHAVLAVGYDDETQRFIVRNSWGANWGQQGYFTMPYAYLLDDNLSDDFWTLRSVEG